MAEAVAAAKAIAAFLATQVVMGVTVGNIILAAYVVGSAVEQRRAARNAARAARAAYYASLQDRSVMVRTAIAPRNYVYGVDKVSGPVVDMFTTGDKNEFLHILVALAGRTVDAIPAIYFNEWAIQDSEIDGDGYVTAERWRAKSSGTPTEQSLTVSGAGTLTLARAASEIVSITWYDAGNMVFDQQTGWSHTPGTATISGLTPGRVVDVSYTWAETHSRVRIHRFLGDHGSVPTALLDETNGRRTAAHVGHGVAWLWVRIEWDEDVFGQVGVPNISALVRGHRVLDPRTGSTAWSDNAALCAADFARDQALGLGCSAAEVPATELMAEANLCDELLPVHNAGTVNLTNGSAVVTMVSDAVNWVSTRVAAGMWFAGPDGVQRLIESVQFPSPGTLTLAAPYSGATVAGAAYTVSQRRYTSNGTLSAADGRLSSFDALLEAMAGHAVWTQGRWRLRAGAHQTPEPITITVDHLADSPPRWQRSTPRRDLFNAVSTTYRDPSANYSEVQAPIVSNATYEAQDGGRRITRSIQLNMVAEAMRAQRLAKITLERARQSETLEIETNLRAYNLAPGQVVPVTIARYGWASKLFEVRSRELNIQAGTVRYVLRGTAPEVWDWNFGAATAVDPAPDTSLPSPFTRPPRPTGLTLATGTATLLRLSDGTIVARVSATWALVPDAFVQRGGRIEVQWRPESSPDWSSEPALPGDATTHLIGPLDEGVPVLVRVRAVNAAGRPSEWAAAGIVVAGKEAPPSNVGGMSGTVTQGVITWSWDACADLDYAHTEVRGSDANWGSDTVQPMFRARANKWAEGVDTAGTYTRRARHFDASGNYSTSAATATVVVTAADLDTGGGRPLLRIAPVSALVQAGALGDVSDWSAATALATITAPDGSDDTANGWTYTVDSTTNVTATLVGTHGNELRVTGFASGVVDAQFRNALIQVHGYPDAMDTSQYGRAPRSVGGAVSFVSGATPVGDGFLRLSGSTPWGLGGQVVYGASINAADPDATLVDVSGQPWVMSTWVRINAAGGSGPTWRLMGYDAREVRINTSATGAIFSASWRHELAAVFNAAATTTSQVYATEVPHGTWVHVLWSYCSDGVLRLFIGGTLRASTSLGAGRIDDVHEDGPYSTEFRLAWDPANWTVSGPQTDMADVRHVAGVSGPLTSTYTPPTTLFNDSAAPAAGSVSVKASKSGQPDLYGRFDVAFLRASPPSIVASVSPTALTLDADWQGNVTGGSLVATYSVLVDGVQRIGSWGIVTNPDQISGLTATISGATVTATSMSAARASGQLRAWMSSPGFPAQQLLIGVTKRATSQPVVIPGGPTLITVAGATDGSVPSASLPLSATVTALQAGTDMATSYSWTPTASAGLTATNTGGAPTVQLTAMTTGTDSGTITMTGTRAGWPQITWVIAVAKSRLLLPSGQVVRVFQAATAYDEGSSSLDVSVRYTSNGLIQTYTESTATWTTVGNWYWPTTAGIGSSHRVRINVSSTTGLTGAFNDWVSLASDVTYTAAASTAGSSVVLAARAYIVTSTATTVLGQGDVNLISTFQSS